MKVLLGIVLLVALGFVATYGSRVSEAEAIDVGKQALSDLIADVDAETLQWSAHWENGAWYVEVVPLNAWEPASATESALQFPLFVAVSADGKVTGRMYR